VEVEVGALMDSLGSACGSKDDEEVSDELEEPGEADNRVRRSSEGNLSKSAIDQE